MCPREIPEASHMPRVTGRHGRETPTLDRTEHAMKQRRKGFRGLVIRAVVLAARLPP
jgi:hypothetical protein